MMISTSPKNSKFIALCMNPIELEVNYRTELKIIPTVYSGITISQMW